MLACLWALNTKYSWWDAISLAGVWSEIKGLDKLKSLTWWWWYVDQCNLTASPQQSHVTMYEGTILDSIWSSSEYNIQIFDSFIFPVMKLCFLGNKKGFTFVLVGPPCCGGWRLWCQQRRRGGEGCCGEWLGWRWALPLRQIVYWAEGSHCPPRRYPRCCCSETEGWWRSALPQSPWWSDWRRRWPSAAAVTTRRSSRRSGPCSAAGLGRGLEVGFTDVKGESLVY